MDREEMKEIFEGRNGGICLDIEVCLIFGSVVYWEWSLGIDVWV